MVRALAISSLSTVDAKDISDDAKFALAFTGLDPILTTLPQLDARLQAFAALGFKPKAVQVKLVELGAARNNPSFKNHLFELSVLGDLALKKVLTDIEKLSTAADGGSRSARPRLSRAGTHAGIDACADTLWRGRFTPSRGSLPYVWPSRFLNAAQP